MSTPHDEHDDLLHAHLAGDVPAGDPLLRTRLEQCSLCRERLEELRSVTDLLEQVGGAQRRSLAAAPARAAPGTERVAATLQALAAGRPPALRALPSTNRRTTLWRVGLAAASVLAAGWIVKTLLPPAEEPRDDVLLGDGQDRSASPNGTVEAFDVFDWPGRPRDAQHFQLRVWCTEQDPSGVLVVDESVERFPWSPTQAQLEEMGRSIAWEVVHVDALGMLGRSLRKTARIEP